MKKYCLLLLVLLLPAMAVADTDDHDKAKRLRDAGEIISLDTILLDVRSRHVGRILEIELERKRGRYVYEIEIVDDAGKVHEYFYDARDGRLLWEETDESETEK